jgi:ABC-type branched-subunit amino acid transport system substrate-binding protein
MTIRRIVFAFSAMLAGACGAARADNIDIVRDLAGRVGPIVGSAAACRDIARPRVQTIADKFAAVIRETATNDADRDSLLKLLDRNIADGREAVVKGQVDCKQAERQLAQLERSITTPSVPPAGPSAGATALAVSPVESAPPNPAPFNSAPITISAQRGITDREIRFGIAAGFTGPIKELARQVKLGIETAFSRANDAGGVHGRMLRLVAADDGYDPGKTLVAMKQLYEKDQVFGFIGNVGTPTAVVAVPYALERRMLFFGAVTGSNVVRSDPPDRYVFNYRPSYAEETDATVRYLVKIRRLQPRQIAVFAQHDAFGDSGFAGVAKAFRALGFNDNAILRVGYERNSINVDDAIRTLRAQKVPIKAVVMVAAYRAAAKFIEKTRDLYPDMIYTNVSFVDGTALAEELALLGPRYGNGVIVTQVVPAVGGNSSTVLEYKNAVAKYFPGENPGYGSLEGYLCASMLIQAMTRAGPQLDTEKLIDTLESMRNLDLGLGTPLSFGRAEHQASHKIWGTALDQNGKYQAIELQ